MSLLTFLVSLFFASGVVTGLGEDVGEPVGLALGATVAAGVAEASGLLGDVPGFGSHALNAAAEAAKIVANNIDLLIDFLLACSRPS